MKMSKRMMKSKLRKPKSKRMMKRIKINGYNMMKRIKMHG
jgi:hypothetical protein